MQTLRSMFWLSVLLSCIVAILLPAIYLTTAATLPDLETEYQVETLMRFQVEGERRSFRAGVTDRAMLDSIAYKKPELARYPKTLVGLYLSQLDCPKFLTKPREDASGFAWRTFRWAATETELPGDGACELFLLNRVINTLSIGPKSALQRAVAAIKLRSALSKEQMLAYELSSIYFEENVIGVDEGSRVILGRPVDKLSLPELAEFALVFPTNGYWQDLKTCRNPLVIKQNRDFVLTVYGWHKFIPPEEVKAAQAAPMSCPNTP